MGKKNDKKKAAELAAVAEYKARQLGAKAAKKAAKAEAKKVAEAMAIVEDKKAGKKERKAARRFLEAVGAAPGVAEPVAGTPAADADDAPAGEAPAVAEGDGAELSEKATRHLAHLERVGELARIVEDPATKKKARAAAEAELAQLRAEGEKLNALKDVKVGGVKTSVEALQAIMDADAKPSVDDPDDVRKARVQAKRKAREKAAEPVEEVSAPQLPDQEATVVETERGREFAVGTPQEPEVIAAVDPDDDDFDTNGLGQYVVQLPGQTKTKGYTRVTTYIDCLEDKSRLTDWKMREVLIGAGLDYEAITSDSGSGDERDSLLYKAVQAYTRWEAAYRKAAKREAKGELDLGQFGLIRGEADKKLRDEVNALTERAMEFAGANERRQKGTDLHALTERLDRGEFTLSDEDTERLVETGQATHADIADLRVYRAKMEELGIEHVAIEQRVVIDELGVAGTLDRASLYKFPGSSRRTRVVGDLKTGRVDYSAGKIGMQLKLYAMGEGYDKETGTRSKLGLSQSRALLIHLPAGEARCEVYEVDLELAAAGVKLAAQVRDWRNKGKKVYDLKSPLTPLVAEEAAA